MSTPNEVPQFAIDAGIEVEQLLCGRLCKRLISEIVARHYAASQDASQEWSPHEGAACKPGGNYGLCKTHSTCVMVQEMLADEKKRRIYYQDIAYSVCNALDKIDGKKPGTGIQCGTIDGPSTEVQERMKLMATTPSREVPAAADAEPERPDYDWITPERLKHYIPSRAFWDIIIELLDRAKWLEQRESSMLMPNASTTRPTHSTTRTKQKDCGNNSSPVPHP